MMLESVTVTTQTFTLKDEVWYSLISKHVTYNFQYLLISKHVTYNFQYLLISKHVTYNSSIFSAVCCHSTVYSWYLVFPFVITNEPFISETVIDHNSSSIVFASAALFKLNASSWGGLGWGGGEENLYTWMVIYLVDMVIL